MIKVPGEERVSDRGEIIVIIDFQMNYTLMNSIIMCAVEGEEMRVCSSLSKTRTREDGA